MQVNISKFEVITVLFSSLNLFKSLFCSTYINEYTLKGVSRSAAVFVYLYFGVTQTNEVKWKWCLCDSSVPSKLS